MPQINNFLKGQHNLLKLILNAVHLFFWKFIDALEKKEKFNRGKIHKFTVGNEPKLTKKKYKDSALRIKNICEQFACQSNNFLKSITQDIQI